MRQCPEVLNEVPAPSKRAMKAAGIVGVHDSEPGSQAARALPQPWASEHVVPWFGTLYLTSPLR